MKAQPNTLKVTIYVYAKEGLDKQIEFNTLTFKPANTAYWGALVHRHDVEITLPSVNKSDLIHAQINALEAEKEKVLASVQIEVNRIEDRIQSLLCIEGEPVSVSDMELPY
ncbi:hypothetical protein KKJ22_15800 [Xenorhabdus bovienii]|uniref:hypothetical protein n=1 Tax=Xenorhabdus bovienii TaxID=40576 RepID=UPI00237C9936|nr:hypothetical protein [Xenorhabdus bovienii]MDE1494504.1 hypothetical protein [Xenorhabdus bovienii]MDE9472646.1 hypothetical protein [Xenorhabdus bovienii]MDE9483625.1 hypothetical protein [Xenorhabdus bovienii]MDE9499241.1 hypothetical protein [Xenorhabdus bovienii]MDE9533727.1 hypothetical protein [Xenorhabdus bovienii]